MASLDLPLIPWRIDGSRLHPSGKETPPMHLFSEHDHECIEASRLQTIGLKLSQQSPLTHGYDWQAARDGLIRVEDMIDAHETKERTIAALREATRRLT